MDAVHNSTDIYCPITEHQAMMRIAGFLADGLWLLLAVFLLPAAVLLIGAPIALAIRAILELVRLFV